MLELAGGRFAVKKRCQDCGRESILDCEDVRPNPIALQLASLFLCDSCTAASLAAEERAHRVELVKRHLRESGMPRPLAEACASWDDLIEEGRTPDETQRRRDAIAAARAWAGRRKPHRGLLLHGDPGTGKTRLAATAAIERMTHSPIRWVSVGVLMAQLEGAWNDVERQEALRVLTSKGAVVLDDFDKIMPNRRMQGALFTALDKREQSGAAIVVTTNLPPARLEEHVGDVIVSRLIGLCQVLRYPGPDFRVELS